MLAAEQAEFDVYQNEILAEITKLQTKAMLWNTTHSGVRSAVQNELPMANPAVRDIAPNLRDVSDQTHYGDVIRNYDTGNAALQPDWRTAPREE